jgi:hypothetical protein
MRPIWVTGSKGPTMRHLRRLRLAAMLAFCATALAFVAGTASAKQILRESFHDEGTVVIEDFCGVPGLTVEDMFVVDGSVRAVPHGPNGLAYFLEHVTTTDVFTNVANGKAVTAVGKATEKDLKVTDNGDGTLTILVLATGNAVLYGPDGKPIARDPGQIRGEILVDHGGTPTDPFDDEFIAFLGIVKGSTGRSDDFCAAMVTALG